MGITVPLVNVSGPKSGHQQGPPMAHCGFHGSTVLHEVQGLFYKADSFLLPLNWLSSGLAPLTHRQETSFITFGCTVFFLPLKKQPSSEKGKPFSVTVFLLPPDSFHTVSFALLIAKSLVDSTW